MEPFGLVQRNVRTDHDNDGGGLDPGVLMAGDLIFTDGSGAAERVEGAAATVQEPNHRHRGPDMDGESLVEITDDADLWNRFMTQFGYRLWPHRHALHDQTNWLTAVFPNGDYLIVATADFTCGS